MINLVGVALKRFGGTTQYCSVGQIGTQTVAPGEGPVSLRLHHWERPFMDYEFAEAGYFDRTLRNKAAVYCGAIVGATQ